MIYVLMEEYDEEVSKVYEGPDGLDLQALNEEFQRYAYRIEPFVPPATKCNPERLKDVPRCRCQGVPCDYRYREERVAWSEALRQAIKKARADGVKDTFADWVAKNYDLREVEWLYLPEWS